MARTPKAAAPYQAPPAASTDMAGSAIAREHPSTPDRRPTTAVASPALGTTPRQSVESLSLIHISEPTRLALI
eukprot:12744352-Alexandrium_andersonii.AAC.1